MGVRRRHSLAFRFSLTVFFLVMGVTTVSMLTEAYISYREEISRFNSEIDQIQKSHMPSIVSSLWVIDYYLLGQQVEAISRFPYVARVEVVGCEGQVFSAGAEDVQGFRRQSQKIIYERRDSRVDLGSLIIYADRKELGDAVLRRISFSLLTHLFLALAVSLLIAYLFHRNVGRYLEGLAVHVQKNSFDDLGKPFDLPSSRKLEDELDQLIRSVNEMRLTVQKQIEERALLVSEVQHRVKNTMLTMVSLLAVQADTTGNPEVAEALKDAGSRFQSMEVLYNQLYRREGSLGGSVREYLEQLTERLVDLFPAGRKIRVVKQIDNFLMDAKTLSNLGIIVNELVTNAMKYGFSHTEEGELHLLVQRRKQAEGSSDEISLMVKGNGPGLPPGFDPAQSTSFGMTMVTVLTKQLDGTLSFENDGGTKVTVVFPYGAPPEP